MERRVNYLYTLGDAYKRYKKVTKSNISERLSESKFREVFNVFMEEYLKLCWDKGQPARFPYGLGHIYILKKKEKVVNLYESKKQKKRVYFNLDSTGGYVYYIRYEKGRLPYSWAYKLIKSKIRKILTQRIRDYIKLDKYYPAYKIQ